jgi:multiple sugar transport system substrate-binding protein
MANEGNSSRIKLTGSTWGHERGYASLKALNANHSDLFPADVDWDVRTLQQFADQSMSELSKKYDFVVFDHPWTGEIATQEYFYPLDQFLSKEFLAEQKANSVGKSYESYIWKDHIYGLQIDTAGHVSAARSDLLEKNNVTKPGTWIETLSLAKTLMSEKKPLLALPLDPVNIWCLFMTLAANKKLNPYQDGKQVLADDKSLEILNFIIELSKFGPKEALGWNPIHLLDAMSSGDEVMYCPALFGYSNYGMAGFRKKLIEFGPIPSSGFGAIGGILGGAGIGITKSCKNPEIAAKVIEVIGSPKIQRTLYATTGGQSGHRSAWLDSDLNAFTNNFYANTLENMDNSYLRPRFAGFVEVQTDSGDVLAEAVYGKISPEKAIQGINQIYQDKLKKWSDFQ